MVMPGRAIREPFAPLGPSFLSLVAGPYLGVSSRTTASTVSVSTGTQVAFGVRFGGGVDVLASERVTLGGVLRYHLMSDFDRPIALREDYGGIEVAATIGLRWGGGNTLDAGGAPTDPGSPAETSNGPGAHSPLEMRH